MPVEHAGEHVVGAVSLALDARAQARRPLDRPVVVGDAGLPPRDVLADRLLDHLADAERAHIML